MPALFAVTIAVASIEPDMAVGVHFTGLHHGGEEHAASHAASIDGRAADGSDLQQRFLTVKPIDVVGFERSIRREVESIGGRNGRDGASLLLSLKDGVDMAEIAGSAQDATFVAVVSGQHPKTIFPGIMNDVVDVPYGALREGIGNIPGLTRVGGRVYVNFIARRIVEVFSPKNRAARNRGDVQRTCPAKDGMSFSKFGFARTKRDNGVWDSRYQNSGRQHRERVNAIAKQAGGKPIDDREPPAPLRVKPGHGLPGQSARRVLNCGANQLVSAGGVELIAEPRQCAQARKARHPNQAAALIDIRFRHACLVHRLQAAEKPSFPVAAPESLIDPLAL